MDVGLIHRVQKPLQALRIENALGLDILGAGVHLLPQLGNLQHHRLVNQGHRRALEEFGSGTGQGIAAAVAAGFLHPGQHPQNSHGVQIVHRLCLPAVTHHRMVACQSQHGVNAEGSRAEHIRQNCHAVPVPAGDLQNRLQARLLQMNAQAQRGGFQAGGLHIGDVDALHLSSKQLRSFQNTGNIHALGRSHLCRHREGAGFQGRL